MCRRAYARRRATARRRVRGRFTGFFGWGSAALRYMFSYGRFANRLDDMLGNRRSRTINSYP